MKLGWSAKMQKLDFIPMKVKLKIVMKSAANNRHNHADQVDIGCQYLRFFSIFVACLSFHLSVPQKSLLEMKMAEVLFKKFTIFVSSIILPA